MLCFCQDRIGSVLSLLAKHNKLIVCRSLLGDIVWYNCKTAVSPKFQPPPPPRPQKLELDDDDDEEFCFKPVGIASLESGTGTTFR